MNLRPSDEEKQLQETMRRFASDHGDVAPCDDAARYDRTSRDFAALGGTMIAVAQERGGLGIGPEGVSLTAFELGGMPLPAPRIEETVLVGRLIDAADSAVVGSLRDRLLSGEARVVLADWEGRGPHAFTPPAAIVARQEDTYRLNGRKAAAIGAVGADVALVTATFEGTPALFAVTLDACVGMTSHRLTDRTPVSDLAFDDVAVASPILQGPAFVTAWERGRDEAIVASAASAVGSMATAIRLTVDYLKVRRQFATPLADFQALQQRVADLYIVANEARSSVYSAIAALSGDAMRRAAAVSGCRLKVARAASHVTGEAVHLHGGIGFSAEYAVGHHHRRALVDEQLFGDETVHMARYLRDSGRTTTIERTE